MYGLAHVNALVSPYQSHLLDLYYAYVQPSLPILWSRPHLEDAIAACSIPASLVAVVYCSAIPFWHHSTTLRGVTPIPREPLQNFVFKSVTLEARTPSLETIRTMLLYMHLPPLHVREPNHPGFWAWTCQVNTQVGVESHCHRSHRRSQALR